MRTAKFVARKQWIVCGSDDMFIRVYNYNTMDKVKAFEAHTDYIRCPPSTMCRKLFMLMIHCFSSLEMCATLQHALFTLFLTYSPGCFCLCPRYLEG